MGGERLNKTSDLLMNMICKLANSLSLRFLTQAIIESYHLRS